ncbi:hypothetical protein I307_06003 [Cryptococcus deuterogattii 99/473]|uniref:Unplaced genomic scaffold supercont1.12, whole genome shotgun sequence n=1 Tax=Cryptococcus deuterogattii Ram5 TaxID=1296110 RepID=A0A0D0T101_9TREE|nr:hypothetical protein I313_04974 [Cryptococcus deuterogattii Ram5]KIY54625.1 hypothetical protein I307_06003 [Cryptococcus deuterogattii 99/473]
MPTRATRSTQEAPPTSPLAPAAELPMNKRKRPSHDPPKRPFPDQKRPRVISKPTGTNEEHEEADSSSPLGMSPPPRSSEPNVLSLEVRDALMDIISQMALGLPEPLEKALTLWLPPDFVEEEENTLQYILRQPSLTWEELVDTIHVFSENLLFPVRYPNPIPPRASFNIPPPPLPSHYPPHKIYNFCAALYGLLLDIQPVKDQFSHFRAERWALVQKTSQGGGEWFTGSVDNNEAAKVAVSGEQGDNTLEAMTTQSRLGNATPITLNSILCEKHRDAPLLGESVIRRASLKMNRWKELRRRKAGGGFGSIARGVGIPNVGSSSFTPTFGPAYDSSGTTAGQGYYFTVEAMHERARHREWAQRALAMDQKLEEEDTGECIEENIQDRAPHHTVDGALVENSRLIAELQTWQEIRLRKGIESATQREQILARELLSSLSQLTQVVSPAQLLPALRTRPGWSHTLGRHILSTSSPSIRGTLDPRRPHALHDNTTIQLRSALARNGVSNISNGSLPHNAPALVKTSTMPPPPSPQFSAPPPHILPISSPHNMSPVVTYNVSGRTHSPYLNPATPQPQPHSYSSFSPAPTAMPASSLVHIRPVQTMPPTGSYLRSGPGPSSLRQSLHQTPMGAQGPGVYGSPAGPGNNEYIWRL